MVVYVRGAVGTVVAVDRIAWRRGLLVWGIWVGWERGGREGGTGVAFVGVDVCFAFYDLEV